MTLKISIITVCYNSEKTIKETIKSVEQQTYKNYEHIIVDGASTDNTLNIINDYRNKSKNVKVLSEQDNGIYDAMNKGILLAEGNLIVFLNSDDTFEINALEIIKNQYTEDIDIIFGDLYWFEIYKNNIFEKKLNIDPEKILKEKEMIPHNSTFVKTSLMKENLFDTNLKICADYKFILKMYKQKRKIKYIPYRVTNMMMGGISTTQLNQRLEEHVNCQIEELGYTKINMTKRRKDIKIELFLKKIALMLLPSKLYIKYRYLKRGWRVRF